MSRLSELRDEIFTLDTHIEHLQREISERKVLPMGSDLSYETLHQIAAVEMVLTAQLCEFSAEGDKEGIQVLLSQGLPPSARDTSGKTALHYAAARGHLGAVELLLAHGADPLTLTEDGLSAKDLAAQEGHFKICDLLTKQANVSNEATSQSFASRGDWETDVAGHWLFAEPAAPPAIAVSPVPSADLVAPPDPVTTFPDLSSMVLIMMGLPGRGKTYIANCICRFFSWNGVATAIFPWRRYRHEFHDIHRGVTYDNDDDVIPPLVKDVCRFIKAHRSSIAIIDGTMYHRKRRVQLYDELLNRSQSLVSTEVIFLEIVLTDNELIERNILRAKPFDEDDSFVERFWGLIRQYEKIYTTLSLQTEREYSWIRIQNMETYTLNLISGTAGMRLMYYLQNIQLEPRTMYVTTSGEWKDLVLGRLGGDSDLTDRGVAFSVALANYLVDEISGNEPFEITCSAQKRARSTCDAIKNRLPAVKEHVTVALDDLCYGDCEGKSLNEVRRILPKLTEMLEKDPFNTAWPRGESIRQMFFMRLEPIICELQSKTTPLLIVTHRALVQGILSFFTSTVVDSSSAPEIDVPLHTVFKISYCGTKQVVEKIDLSGVAPEAGAGSEPISITQQFSTIEMHETTAA